ncbi:hypothetical protein HYW55_06605 [Candidatus Gottesmanbacteria bacterium]|nr:hypothetical protein [Candidatus Gottesmanbacteria bacterium]
MDIHQIFPLGNRNSSKILLIVTGSVAVFLLGIGAFFLYKLSSSYTPDQTISWKIFKSTKFFYEIKYPDEYFQETNSIEGQLYLIPNEDNNKIENVGFTLIPISALSEKTVEEFMESSTNKDLYQSAKKKTRMTIAGISGYKLIIASPPSYERKIEKIMGLIKKDDIIFALTLDVVDREITKEDEDLFENILRTFTFTGNPTYDLYVTYSPAITADNEREVKRLLAPFGILTVKYETNPPYGLFKNLPYEKCLDLHETISKLSYVDHIRECVREESKREQLCGGIAGLDCPTGYSCKLEGDYPDAGGKCIAN